jgi:hypothetical protein
MKRNGRTIPEAMEFERLTGAGAELIQGQRPFSIRLYAIDGQPGVYRRVARDPAKDEAVGAEAAQADQKAARGRGLKASRAGNVLAIHNESLIELVRDPEAEHELSQAGFVQQSGPRPAAAVTSRGPMLILPANGPESAPRLADPPEPLFAGGSGGPRPGADPGAEEAFRGIVGDVVPPYLQQRADAAREQIEAEQGIEPVQPDPNPNAEPLPEPETPPEGEAPPAEDGDMTLSQIVAQQEGGPDDVHAEPNAGPGVHAEPARRGRNRRAQTGHGAR